MLAAPPATAANESTRRICSVFGIYPFESMSPASVAIAVTVPTVSKKSDSRRVKTRSIPAMIDTLLNEPSRLKCPRSPKLGLSTILDGTVGTFSPQPLGLNLVSEMKLGPILNAFSISTAARVAAEIPINNAPFTFLTRRPIIKKSPKANTTIGQPTSVPLLPS